MDLCRSFNITATLHKLNELLVVWLNWGRWMTNSLTNHPTTRTKRERRNSQHTGWANVIGYSAVSQRGTTACVVSAMLQDTDTDTGL